MAESQVSLEGEPIEKPTSSIETTHKYVWEYGDFYLEVSEDAYDNLFEKLDAKKGEDAKEEALRKWVEKKIKVATIQVLIPKENWDSLVDIFTASVKETPSR